MLYLVATPIGNLEDIAFRAVRILGEVSLIAAEDTRHTRKLLNHYNIETPMMSFHEHSDDNRLEALVARCAVEDVALVTDAGTPSISDPGYRLVVQAIEAGIQVSPIPGPSAAISGLIASGLPTDRFLFLGFPPKQAGKRDRFLAKIKGEHGSLIFYESPNRLNTFLAAANRVLGNRNVAIGRELTKRFEEIWRGSLEEALINFALRDIKGEITVVIAGNQEEEIMWDDETVKQAIEKAMAEGASRKGAIEEVSLLSGRRKKEVYRIALDSR